MLHLVNGENGKLVPMINWTTEMFDQLVRMSRGLEQPEQAPRYSLEALSITGSAEGAYVEAEIRFQIRTGDANWTRVPLRLNRAVLLPDGVRYTGGGESSLQLDREGEGYVVWLRGDAQEPHELVLSAQLPLDRLGDQVRLRFFAPVATRAEFQLTVPSANVSGEVIKGGTLSAEPLDSAKQSDSPKSAGTGGTTRFDVLGLGGAFELKWRDTTKQLPHPGPVLEATGVLVATVDRQSTATEARLTVQGYGGPFDQFVVALPEGAELLPGNATGEVVSVGPGSEEGALLLKVQRPAKTNEPMHARFAVRQSREAAGGAGWFALDGFEVIGAVRQSGNVIVRTVGKRGVRCAAGRGVRQIEELPEALREEPFATNDVAALFEYFSQPFSLSTRVVDVRTRIRVEPEYQVQVSHDRADLEARLKYTIGGPGVLSLDVELADWQLDAVEPEGMVAEGASIHRNGLLSIPLAKSTTGAAEILIRASRPIAAESSSLRFPFPWPRADLVSPARVVVTPQNNVELIPDPDQLAGLVRQPLGPAVEPREGQRDPLVYRAESEKAQFAAGFSVHPQKILVDVLTEIRLEEDEAEIHQTLAYDIAYEALERVIWSVPVGLVAPGQMTVTLEGQPLTIAPLPGSPALSEEKKPGEAPDRLAVQALLPEPRATLCELHVRYSVDVERPPPNSSAIVTLPLIMPRDGKLVANHLYITAPEGINVRPRQGAWEASSARGRLSARQHEVFLKARGPALEIALGVHHDDLAATVVERAWVQTWLAPGNRRYERAVFRLRSGHEEVEITLPSGVDPRRAEVLIGPEEHGDRTSLSAEAITGSRLVVPLSGGAGRPQWVELRYVCPGPGSSTGRVSIQLASFPDDVWVRRTYWQLVLPRGYHLASMPNGFTPEWRWGFNGTFWGRLPGMEQPFLEDWVGTEHQVEVGGQTSRYVFSTLGAMEPCRVRIVSRWSVVLVASLGVLAAGLLLIYVPSCRHPGALVGVAVVLAAACVYQPEMALLAAQAACLGLVLALAAGLLSRAMTRGRSRSGRRDAASSLFDKGSTEAQHRPPLPAHQGSTATASLDAPSAPIPGSHS